LKVLLIDWHRVPAIITDAGRWSSDEIRQFPPLCFGRRAGSTMQLTVRARSMHGLHPNPNSSSS